MLCATGGGSGEVSRPAARQRGKREEARVAALFGGARAGNRGLPGSDVAGDVPWSVEVKNVSLLGIRGAWIDQARASGRREGKPWLLIVRRKGAHRPTVTLELEHFLELVTPSAAGGDGSA